MGGGFELNHDHTSTTPCVASVPSGSVVRLAAALQKLQPDKVLMIFREKGGHSTNYEDGKKALEFVVGKVLGASQADK